MPQNNRIEFPSTYTAVSQELFENVQAMYQLTLVSTVENVEEEFYVENYSLPGNTLAVVAYAKYFKDGVTSYYIRPYEDFMKQVCSIDTRFYVNIQEVDHKLAKRVEHALQVEFGEELVMIDSMNFSIGFFDAREKAE
jgi:hypothetical protein